MGRPILGYAASVRYSDNGNHDDLLAHGWKIYHPEFDWDYFQNLINTDFEFFGRSTFQCAGQIATILGRNSHSWWANLFALGSEEVYQEIDNYWGRITPGIQSPNPRQSSSLSASINRTPDRIDRNDITIDLLMQELQAALVFEVLNFLGLPDLLLQTYARTYQLPPHKFTNWEDLYIPHGARAFWKQQEVWLTIEGDNYFRNYSLVANNLPKLINQASFGFAAIVSGYQSRLGKIESEFSLDSFEPDIQNFSQQVTEAIASQNRVCALAWGAPGTGKTAWTQALAKEILAPQGFVIFILDAFAFCNFIPPEFLSKIAVLVNEVDDLAQDRKKHLGRTEGRTERVLALLDGTLYSSVSNSSRQSQQKFVVLLTANTTERLDQAMLRKGRIDCLQEFTRVYV